MLPLKDLWGGEKVTGWSGTILEDLEGLLGGRPLEAGTLLSGRAGIYDRQACGGQAEDRCPNNRETIAYRYSMSMITCKWFVSLGIGERGSWEGKWKI